MITSSRVPGPLASMRCNVFTPIKTANNYANLRCPSISRRSCNAIKPYIQKNDTRMNVLSTQKLITKGGRREVLANVLSNTTPNESRADPSVDHAKRVWRNAEAVCFDVDCTITVNDSLDLLAEFMGVAKEVAALTSQAMDGTINLATALEKRLEIINCTPSDIRAFIKTHPPESRLAPGIEPLVRALHARGVAVFLISGGFRELTLPIASYLGINRENVFANRMNWQWDDATGEPTRLVGFDTSEPTARNQGKPQAIAAIRNRFPYKNIVMIGDGITDLEAVQTTGGADLFIGYGGVVVRPAVKDGAEWFVYSHGELLSSMKRYKIAMVGSGAWACAAVRMVGQSVMTDDPANAFDDEVRMWVYEEEYEGRKLTEVINEKHENPKYLAGIHLGDNIVAEPSLERAVEDADCLILCAPHQFLHRICKQLVGKVKKDAMAISLTKGMRVRSDGPQLISQMVTRYLGIDCSVLMGANIAIDIAREELSEAVIGYAHLEHARVWERIFSRPYFGITLLPDPVGAEMCGTLKNIVAVGAGIVDGLGKGPNAKAAIMRQGLQEMKDFSKELYPTVRDETFLQACGMADLVATCYGGRNRLVAQAWTKAYCNGQPTSFEVLERDLLAGQKLQGVLTSNEVQEIIKSHGWEKKFPLFTTINRIVNNLLSPDWIFRYKEGASKDLGHVQGSMSDFEDVVPHKPPVMVK